MKTLAPISELARRAGRCSRTLQRHFDLLGIRPDAEVLVGQRRIALFDLARPEVSRIVAGQTPLALNPEPNLQ